ncbi:MAG: hypothetical protein A2Y24_03560 [Clostridiales bacterium GWE2_32_10]|nr:MAG: hypothetical protein A2Y24_03560 [Clostridiales bacterium GWE2_32_10]HBY19569.1 hypothetical protein [Clostridiales bacterium]
MDRLNIVLADKHKAYREALAGYIMEMENERIKIVSFSNQELLENYIIANTGNIDMIVAEVDFMNETVLTRVPNFVILSETEVIEDIINYEYIFKYQLGEKIVAKILDVYYSDPRNNKARSNKDTNVYAIYSIGDTTAKTNLSLDMCKSLAREGKRVFYLSFDSLSDIDIHKEVEKKGLSNILLDLKTRIILEKIKEYISKNKEDSIDFFVPFQNFLEYYELGGEDAEKIVNALKELKEYDYIVVELGMDFGIVTSTVLKQADRKFVIYGEDSKGKAVRLKNDLELDTEKRELTKNMELISETMRAEEALKGRVS